MAGNAITIEGIDDVLMMYANAQNDLSKAALKAVRDSSRSVARDIKAASPARFRQLVKATAKKTRDGGIYGRIGFRNSDGTPSGKDIPDWFKAYWKNYGTLTHRVPSSVHVFDNPVKGDTTEAAQRRRNRTGQSPELFFDNAVEGWDRKFLEEFKNSLNRQGYPVE